MKEEVRMLIQHTIHGPKKYVYEDARKILNADKTLKDRAFAEKMLREIDRLEAEVDVPANCAMFTIAEKEADINLDRYYVTEREKIQAEKIFRMHHVSKMLQEKKIKNLNSLMIYGKPGTGKTTFGRYIAKKMNLPFIYINMSYILDSYLGASQKNVGNLFRFINETECVFMIDELDSIAQRRGAKSEIGEISRLTICLMQEIDRLNGDVILIGATNRYDIIDDAIKSRFGEPHEVMPLSGKERDCFIRMYLDDVGIEYTESDIDALCMQPDTYIQRQLEKAIISFITDTYYKKLDYQTEEAV